VRDSGLPIDPNNTAEARVMRLRGYGNSIVPQLAAEFIGAYLDTIRE
jgi:DNA (cytosine-5)-methyltransferase 1